MDIEVEAWSHGGDCWMYYGCFESEDSAVAHITSKGYDLRFFRIGAKA